MNSRSFPDKLAEWMQVKLSQWLVTDIFDSIFLIVGYTASQNHPLNAFIRGVKLMSCRFSSYSHHSRLAIALLTICKSTSTALE